MQNCIFSRLIFNKIIIEQQYNRIGNSEKWSSLKIKIFRQPKKMFFFFLYTNPFDLLELNWKIRLFFITDHDQIWAFIAHKPGGGKAEKSIMKIIETNRFGNSQFNCCVCRIHSTRNRLLSSDRLLSRLNINIINFMPIVQLSTYIARLQTTTQYYMYCVRKINT